MKVEIKEHSNSWKIAFELERAFLEDVFKEEAKAVEHMGSTSIPNLKSKPVIDIFLAVTPFRECSHYHSLLKNTNYRYTKTDMLDRYLFSKYSLEGEWTHNVHIVPFDKVFFLRNELLFRDYLRNNPDFVFKYNKLKEQLVIKEYKTLEDYTRSKTRFIQLVVDRARVEKGLQRQDVWTMGDMEEV